MTKIPKALKHAICNNELVVFAGAGLSYNLKNIKDQPLEGWGNLVKQILEYLKTRDYSVSDLLPLISNYEPIKVLDLIESNKKIPKTEIYSFIKDFLDLDDTNNFELHKKLFQLSRKIITTNYDTAFEKACSELRKNKAYKGKNYELTKHKDPNAALLFKLHGCFEDANSMVLFPTNYKNLYENTDRDAEHSLLVLKNIIHNKSILFIGTGMGDFQINNIFKVFKQLEGDYHQNHFIITNKPLDSTLNFLTPITINNHAQIQTVIDDLIQHKETCTKEESEEVKKLKAQLLSAEQQIETLNSQNMTDKDKLEREALKYFSKGVAFSLSNQHDKSLEEYKAAVELKSDFHEAYYNWGTGLSYLARTKTGEASAAMFELAFTKYEAAIGIKSDYHEAYNNWGTDLSYLARTKTGEASAAMFELAFTKYAAAIGIKSDYHEAYYNWGTDLSYLARTKTGEASAAMFELAFTKYKAAIGIKSDFHEAYNNWGTDLGYLARTKTGEASAAMFELAFTKYETAIGIKSDYHKAYYNWGTDLSYLARTKTGEASAAMFELAFTKYEAAIGIKSDFHEAYYNWGTDLGYLAQTKTGKTAKLLFDKAISKFKLGIDFGGESYNLSCLYAITNHKENAFKYLDLCLTNKEITVNFVKEDEDWKTYLMDKSFNDILNKHI